MIAPGSARKKIVFASALLVLLAASGAIQLRILHLKGKDLTVPFAYGGDAVEIGRAHV